MRFFKGYDLGIIIPTVLILIIGLIVLSSVDPVSFKSQLLFSVIGLFLFFVCSSLHTHALKNSSLLFYIVSILLLLSVLLIGINVRGSRRWIELFGFRLQFSEIIKPFLILSFASLLSAWQGKISLLKIAISSTLFLVIALLLSRQPDLGNAIVFGTTFLFMLLYAGMSFWYLLVGAVACLALGPILWNVLADYQKNRIVTFFNPSHDPLGIGYNAIQSAIAVGSGLFFGRGLGRGIQSQLQFLPERHTDFIFATFSEEFGFLGSVMLLLLYLILLVRILRVVKHSRDSFDTYIVLGTFTLLLAQIFINVGMNVGILPITGVTLPLVSYGGSSLISTMIMLGIVNSISRDTKQKQQVLEIR